MDTIIEFKNTNFGFNNTNTFNDFNMEIEKGDIVTLIGPSGSGKTTLLKMLCNKLPNDSVYYKGKNIKEYKVSELQKEIIVVFDAPIVSNKPLEELERFLKKINLSEEEINARVENFKEIFNLSRLENKTKLELTFSDSYLIKILRFLIVEPSFIAIDNILTNINVEDKNKIIEFIKEKGITLLNVTTNLDESLYGNKLFVLENFVLILEGNTITILKTDTLLKRLGFKLPMTVDLSIELNHYDILDKIYTEKEKLVDELWK